MSDVVPLHRPTRAAELTEVMPHTRPLVDVLLRCEWGETVWDVRGPRPERCRLDATSIVCVHRETDEVELRLCTEHRAFVDTQTTPRESE